MMELLAPAGTPDRLWAALSAGADAVYLGGKQFSARRFAGNFTNEEIKEAVALCHALGKSVYVTLNILISDTEIPELLAYLDFLGTTGIDGLLVQDLGVARLARERIPHVPLHASTQMTVSNLSGVEFLRTLGFKRVVLSRELSHEEISYIAHHTDVEIEVFVHGALCVSYSGQCLMSSFIGGRSGNRGACAQPCRMPYRLTDEAGKIAVSSRGDYILSLRDMVSLESLSALSEAGVVSLKVEGRMKEPEYVYAVISAYREALDAMESGAEIDEKELLRRMQARFNRGYTEGYAKNEISGAMMTGDAPGNHGVPAGYVVRKGKGNFTFLPNARPEGQNLSGISYVTVEKSMAFVELSSVRFEKNGSVFVRTEKEAAEGGAVYWVPKPKKENFGPKYFMRRIPLTFTCSAMPGQPVTLSADDGAGHCVSVSSEFSAEAARERVTGEDEIAGLLSRLGNTIYTFGGAAIRNDGCMVPKSVVNHLRQDVCEKMSRLRIDEFEKSRGSNAPILLPVVRRRMEETGVPRLFVRTDDEKQALEAMAEGAGVIFGGESFSHRPIPVSAYQKVLETGREKGLRVIFSMPRVVRQMREEAARTLFLTLGNLLPDAMEIRFPGAMLWAKELPETVGITGEASLNIFNAEGLFEAADWGLSSVYVSPECTLSQIRHMAKVSPIPIGVTVYGRQEMMISEYCVVNAVLGKGRDKMHCEAPCMRGRYALSDGGGRLFPIRTDEACHMHILNSAVTDMRPQTEKLSGAGISYFVIDVRGTKENAGALVRSFAHALAGGHEAGLPGATRGHFVRGVL